MKEAEVKWQRPAIAALALAGIADTAYLLFAHATRARLACPAVGAFDCDAVVTSAYSSVLGFPLAAWGMAAYVLIAALALGPWLLGRLRPAATADLPLPAATQTLWALRALASALVGVGLFLLYLMLVVIKGLCLYCLASLAVSAALLCVTLVDRGGGPRRGFPAMIGLFLAAGAITVVAAAPGTAAKMGPYEPLEGVVFVPLQTDGDFSITTTSGSAEMALARHLAATKSRMYGGFRCVHCHRMKQLFGAEAWKLIAYVECDPRSPDVKTRECDEAGVKDLPTWIVGYLDREGRLLHGKVEGEMDLFELGDESGYKGSTAFLRRIQLNPGEAVFDPENYENPPPPAQLDLGTQQ
ncbi:MAG: vitamin K epoxide reductase family protein [Candidatus Sericytochromatia bacterium]|nr:vitamin K epoxide reductase family protein [Candidatus Tanganyikabacteria bacterium]